MEDDSCKKKNQLFGIKHFHGKKSNVKEFFATKLRTLFIQGLSCQIWIVLKLNVMSNVLNTKRIYKKNCYWYNI